MAKYKLNDAERVKVIIAPFPMTKIVNGKAVVDWMNKTTLIPGKVYETEDKAVIDFFKTTYKRKVRYSADVERALKSANVPYEIEYCKSCGGRIKKINYLVVEVYDE